MLWSLSFTQATRAQIPKLAQRYARLQDKVLRIFTTDRPRQCGLSVSKRPIGSSATYIFIL